MFLDEITFLKDFRCYKKNEKIKFNNQVTIISGDNGSGKSTLISCIRKQFKTKWTHSDDICAEEMISTGIENSKKIEIAYLCFSSDMLKNSSSFDDDISLHIKVLNLSSGQGSLEQLVDKVEKNKEKQLLILDEPEKGLSIKRVFLILKYLKKHIIENPNQQIIIVTHSEILMNLSEELYSTSHKKTMSRNDYLSWIYKDNKYSPFADDIIF